MESFKHQPELKQLFNNVNKRCWETGKDTVIAEEELNRIRAYVVKSKYLFLFYFVKFLPWLGQRPLQSVRLLQMERQERITDEEFIMRKEKIIEQARILDQ